MSTQAALSGLLRDPRLWRAGAEARAAPEAIPSGLAALDALLPGGGWPAAALTEILGAGAGRGEFALLLPVLRALTGAGREVVLVAPPYEPFAPALAGAGVSVPRLHVLEVAREQVPWAMEQCLRAGACGAVLGWSPSLGERAVRRLQFAARSGCSPGFVFRPGAAAARPSPAGLRVVLEEHSGRLRLRIIKCRGARAHVLEYRPPGWD